MALSTSPPRLPRLYIHSPTVVFQASVNLVDPAEYPIAFLPYDNVTIGDYEAVEDGMTLLLGTTPGGDELGRQRVTDDSTTIAIRIAYTSRGTRDGELLVVDNAYITVLDDRRLWAKMPFIDSAGEVFKDDGVEVGDNNVNPPPVAVMQAGYAATAIDGERVVTLDASYSFAVADGATITDYLWNIRDGTLITGLLTDSEITVSFPMGFRHPSLTVTDSNGKSHTTYRPFFIDDPNDRGSTTNFRITGHTITEMGQAMTIELFDDYGRGSYPDGTLVMIWDKEPVATSERDHLIIIGWLDAERSVLSASETGFTRNDSLAIVDIGGRLNKVPGFAQMLTDELLRDEEIDPDTTWQFMPSPNVDKFMVFLLWWHCTALEIADFFPSGTWELYPFVELQASGTSLYNQVARLAQMLVPDYRFWITTLGEMKVIKDQMLINVEDRTENVIVELQESEWQEVSWDYNRVPRTHVLWGQATIAATEYEVVDDDTLILTVKSIAPGPIYGQGLGESTWLEQLAISQEALNEVTGHRYARINSRYGPLTIRVPGVMVRDEFELDVDGWVILHISEEFASRRGFPSTTIRGRLISCSPNRSEQPTGATYDTTLSIEIETSGDPAMSWDVLTGEATPGDGEWTPPEVTPPPLPPTVPPTDGLIEGQQMVAAIDGRTGANPTLYRTFDFQTPDSSGGPEWEAISLGITDDFLRSFVVDPFSPGYLEGTGPINAWAVGNEAIWRIEDLFGTPSATAIYTYSFLIDGSSRFQSRSINATFGTFFSDLVDNPWLMVVSHYADLSGHEGTWANYSVDAGVTWSGDILISEHYDTDLSGSEPHVIPSVYLSPKTPGLAYACAYLETDNPALAGGYVSTDWGATWTALAGVEDEDEPLPSWSRYGIDYPTWEYLGPSTSQSIGGGDVDGSYSNYLNIHPPQDAKRIRVEGSYLVSYFKFSGHVDGFARFEIAGSTTLTSSLAPSHFVAAPEDTTVTGDYWAEWARGSIGSPWEMSREEAEGVSPSPNTIVPNLRARWFVGGGRTTNIQITARVVEIELWDGTIYTPIELGAISPNHRLGGYLHGPWLDNDDEALWYYGNVTRGASLLYKLSRANGATITDISPSHSGKDYGQNRTTFGVRTHDSDSSKVLLGGVANDASANSSDDVHAIFKSEDGGDTFDLIYGPLTDADFGQTKGFGVAWGGDTLDVIFAWGASGGDPGTILYSDDNGVTFDDRSGNLSTLAGGSGPDGFIGIAGGPT